jgi:septal ring factor EnvC (AmiA/AmiB activator)
MAADRQSLLNELKNVKDENQKLQEDLRKIQDEEKQFKRECKMFIEFNFLNKI